MSILSSSDLNVASESSALPTMTVLAGRGHIEQKIVFDSWLFFFFNKLLFLSEQEENLKRAKKGDLKVSIHQMEMERIRFVLSSYLRCRLMKVGKPVVGAEGPGKGLGGSQAWKRCPGPTSGEQESGGRQTVLEEQMRDVGGRRPPPPPGTL